MTNQEIYRYVNSKDIRKHLQNLNYQFSSLEAAWLVSQAVGTTLEDRWNAWEDIIRTMPDQPVESPHFIAPYDSLHSVLKRRIQLEKELWEKFHEETGTSFFQVMTVEPDFIQSSNYSFDDSPSFSSFEESFNYMMDEFEDIENIFGVIRRSVIDHHSDEITVDFSKEGICTNIESRSSIPDEDLDIALFFDEIWLCMPAPFKTGDILYDPYHRKGYDPEPVVITGTAPMFFEEDGRKHADPSDMVVCGYFQSEDGTIFHEVTHNYMDFEYYPKERLTGKKRILKALGNLLKDKIGIELFIKAYHMIILEETKNDITPHGWFTDEGLILAGLKEEPK